MSFQLKCNSQAVCRILIYNENNERITSQNYSAAPYTLPPPLHPGAC